MVCSSIIVLMGNNIFNSDYAGGMPHLPKGLTKVDGNVNLCQGLTLTMKITMGYFIFMDCDFHSSITLIGFLLHD